MPRTARSPRTTRRLAVGGALVATAALLAAPAAALAGDAYIDGAGLAHYTANFGEDNSLRVAERPHPFNSSLKIVTFKDVVPVDPDNGCSAAGTFAADCAVPVSHTLVRADLATLDDRIDVDLADPPTTFGFSAEGNPGDDTLGGSAQRDIFHGGDGSDSIVGRFGNDHLEGDHGNDSITGGVGTDKMYGDAGNDRLDADDDAPNDTVYCGPGNDVAIVDDGDFVANDCELVSSP